MNMHRMIVSERSKLGIDIGRVIIAAADPSQPQDTTFLGGGRDAVLQTPPSAGAFEAIADLVDLFDGRVWLVSKAGKRVREKTRIWLAHHDFFERTGIPPENLRFCYKRHEKAYHCEELGLTHFIDDRIQVLRHLQEGVPWLYLFGPQEKRDSRRRWVHHVEDWEEVMSAFSHCFEDVVS